MRINNIIANDLTKLLSKNKFTVFIRQIELRESH